MKNKLHLTSSMMKGFYSLIIFFIISTNSFAQCPRITCPDGLPNVRTGKGKCDTSNLYLGTYTTRCAHKNITNDAPETFSLGTTVVTWTLTDSSSDKATCKQKVTVKDHEAPLITCIPNITANTDTGACYATITLEAPATSDNCKVAAVTNDAPASGHYPVGPNTVTWTVTDDAGNQATCIQLITVSFITPPEAICKDITIKIDATGNASITAADVNNGSIAACEIKSLTVSPNKFTCANAGENTVTLTLTDNNNYTSTCTATVTVEDKIAPVAKCKNITVKLDSTGKVSITASQINNLSSDDCGIMEFAVTPDAFTCDDIASSPNMVTLIVTDNNLNTSTCTATVTVEDKIAPIAKCKPLIVQLDASGYATINASQIDNGSNDVCGGPVPLTVSPDVFSCANIGDNTVTLIVTDFHNNSSTCTTTVTVRDKEAPVALCQPVTLQLDATGNATLTADQVNNGSSDACGIKTFLLSKTKFDCSNVGTSTVTFTVKDSSNNSSSCTATVTVEDNVAPVPACKNLTLQLDAKGNASITADQVNDGSSDACGIKSVVLNKTAFTCLDIETNPNPFLLTITDINNNVSQCTATVIVEDKIAPVAICKDIIIQLDANGNATISGDAINNGSSDACGIQLLTVSSDAFTCNNVGPNAVMLNVIDNNNNVSTCTSTVTIKDNIAPIAICKDITVSLDTSGNVTIAGRDVDNGSSDNCQITLSVTPNTFNRDKVGSNTVILTVTDIYNNSATCTTTVTIVDNKAHDENTH